MNRRAASIATGALVALTLPLAAPAAAAPPQQGCPPAFDLLTYEAQIALAMQVLGISREEAVVLADETVALIDRNGDRTLCFRFLEKESHPPNVIDNASAAPSR